MSQVNEPVLVGQIRQHGQHAVRVEENTHGWVTLKASDGTVVGIPRMVAATLPLLCPANVRPGDTFIEVGASLPFCIVSRAGDSWLCSDGLGRFITDAAMAGQVRIVARAPVEQRPIDATADVSRAEPVKSGQVRLHDGKPILVRPSGLGATGFLLGDEGEWSALVSPAEVDRMPLLCPALEDLRPGDVFQEVYGSQRVTLDQPDSRQRAWKLVEGGCLFPHEAALGGMFRIVARGPEKSIATLHEPAKAGPFQQALRRADLLLASVVSDGRLSEEQATAFGQVISRQEAEDSAAAAFEVAAAAPKLPGWLTVGAWVTTGNVVYEVTRIDVVNGSARILLTTPGGDCQEVAAHAVRPSTEKDKRWAFAERRDLNRFCVDYGTKAPPRQVLDGFGRRQGHAWDAYQRELAKLLDVCNARAVPALILERDLTACVERAVTRG